jgi:hypothetical protein
MYITSLDTYASCIPLKHFSYELTPMINERQSVAGFATLIFLMSSNPLNPAHLRGI